MNFEGGGPWIVIVGQWILKVGPWILMLGVMDVDGKIAGFKAGYDILMRPYTAQIYKYEWGHQRWLMDIIHIYWSEGA